jgi:hypothetical protein
MMGNPCGRWLLASLAALVVGSVALAPAADAAPNRGGGSQGGAKPKAQVNNSKKDVRTNNVRNTSVNNVNVNKNVNVNVNNNNGCCHGGWDNDYHPVATAVAVTATVAVTAAVIGSIVNAPPPGCVPVNYRGVIYQQCGPNWYMPQGPQYIVVAPPYY